MGGKAFESPFVELLESRIGFVGAADLKLGRNESKFIAGCQLNPGDALYLPPWIWHDIFTLSPSISLGTRFSNLELLRRRHPIRPSKRHFKAATDQEIGRFGVQPKRQTTQQVE